MRDPRLRLRDILDAILSIEMHIEGGKEEFERTPLIQSWVILHLQNIGEAVNVLRELKPDWLARHPEVPWDEIVGMRHRLLHGYFDIRLEPVWEAVEKGLPVLKRSVAALLESES